MRKLIGFLAAAALMAAFSATGLIGASAAYADRSGDPCEGTTCTGLDPTASFNKVTGRECSDGAYSNFTESDFSGTLDLRWGPDCQVNWGRFTPTNNHTYSMVVENVYSDTWVGSGFGVPYTFSNGAGVAFWTDEVYAPDPQPAGVCIKDDTLDPSSTGWYDCYYQCAQGVCETLGQF